jgi:hypothetical protein
LNTCRRPGLRVYLLDARTSERAGLRFAMCSLQPAERESSN